MTYPGYFVATGDVARPVQLTRAAIEEIARAVESEVAAAVGPPTNEAALTVVTRRLNKADGTPAQHAIAVGTTDGSAIDTLRLNARWHTGTITTADFGAQSLVGPYKFIWTDACGIKENNAGALCVAYNISGTPTTTGEATRQAVALRMAINSQVGTFPDYMAFTVQQGSGYAVATQGGPGGWAPGSSPDNHYRGGLLGGNDNVWLAINAANWASLTGREINVSIQHASANAYARTGLFIVDFAGVKQADNDDVAVAIASVPGGQKFKTGIKFGMSWGEFPVSVGGKLIEIKAREYPTPVAPNSVAYGVDFTAGTFSTAAFASPGFKVDGAGAVTQRPAASATPATNGDMMFELTSNTSLRVRVKGSDGVVRSAVLALAP